MTKYLAISAMGSNHPQTIDNITKQINDHDCNIRQSHFSVVGNEVAVVLLVNGRWDAIAKLETSLQKIALEFDLCINVKHTNVTASSSSSLPYQVHVIAVDKAGIVQSLSQFFIDQGIKIIELNGASYPAMGTGTAMFKLEMTVHIAADTQLVHLREQFMIFCDDRNLDAIIEPVRPHL